MKKTVYTVVYDTENFCDGYDMENYDAAVGSALDILMGWIFDDPNITWRPGDGTEPTEEQRDAWNNLVWTCEVRIYKHEAGTICDEDDIVWYMDDAEKIGWYEV